MNYTYDIFDYNTEIVNNMLHGFNIQFKIIKMTRRLWMPSSPKPESLNESKKQVLRQEIEMFITNSPKLSKIINRFEIKGGRIYFYYLVEQYGWNDPKSKFIKPLIEEKYGEFKYARISIYKDECTLDWQRHNDQWIKIFKGTFAECLEQMNENNEWFH